MTVLSNGGENSKKYHGIGPLAIGFQIVISADSFFLDSGIFAADTSGVLLPWASME